jgi:hypothetical protein
MEVIDNLTMALVPGAIDAGLGDARFWLPLLGGFVVAWPVAFADRDRCVAAPSEGGRDDHPGDLPDRAAVRQWVVAAVASPRSRWPPHRHPDQRLILEGGSTEVADCGSRGTPR